MRAEPSTACHSFLRRLVYLKTRLSLNPDLPPPCTQVVDEQNIAEIVSRWTGIPVSKLTASEKHKLLNLAEVCELRVFGKAWFTKGTT